MIKQIVVSGLLVFMCCTSVSKAEAPPEPVQKVLPVAVRRQLVHERAAREAEARRMRLRAQRNANFFRPRPRPMSSYYNYRRYSYHYRYRYYNQQLFYPRRTGVYLYFRF